MAPENISLTEFPWVEVTGTRKKSAAAEIFIPKLIPLLRREIRESSVASERTIANGSLECHSSSFMAGTHRGKEEGGGGRWVGLQSTDWQFMKLVWFSVLLKGPSYTMQIDVD